MQRHFLHAYLAISLSVPVAAAQSTTRSNVSSEGLEASDWSYASSKQAMSADGAVVTFWSFASNLVPGDTNGVADCFVHDRNTGMTSRVSLGSGGAEANDGYLFGGYASLSADGTIVAFVSKATNLVPGDTNGAQDVFVHDLTTGVTTRVSLSSSGIEGDSDSAHLSAPVLSADGTLVVFSSLATNLVPGDTNGFEDVFVYDRSTGTTTRVSVDSSGSQGNRWSYGPAISDDGNFIVFSSASDNLVSGDTNSSEDVFLHHRLTGVTERVSLGSAGFQGDLGASVASISNDGDRIAFSSRSTDLVVGDTNGSRDVFLHTRSTGATIRVSLGPGSTEGNDDSFDPTISRDGTSIAYYTAATNFLPGGDLNGSGLDSFQFDLQTGVSKLINVNSVGEQGDDTTVVRAMSSDGRFFVMQGTATNLVPGDTNGFTDVFVHDRLGPSLTKQGACPGSMTLTISGGTIGQNVALVYGAAGAFTKPTSPCAGVELGIGSPQLAAMIPTNMNGLANLTFLAPAGACSLTVQAVDLAACRVTNPMIL